MELRFLIHLITEIRHIRAEMNVPLSAKPVLEVRGMNELHERSIFNQKAALLRLARLADVNIADGFAKGSARGSVDGLEIGLPLANILDLNAEAERLKKEIASVKAEIEKTKIGISLEIIHLSISGICLKIKRELFKYFIFFKMENYEC